MATYGDPQCPNCGSQTHYGCAAPATREVTITDADLPCGHAATRLGYACRDCTAVTDSAKDAALSSLRADLDAARAENANGDLREKALQQFLRMTNDEENEFKSRLSAVSIALLLPPDADPVEPARAMRLRAEAAEKATNLLADLVTSESRQKHDAISDSLRERARAAKLEAVAEAASNLFRAPSNEEDWPTLDAALAALAKPEETAQPTPEGEIDDAGHIAGPQDTCPECGHAPKKEPHNCVWGG